MRQRPEVNFYCYTKEVTQFRRFVEPAPPENFLWAYSYDGTQNALLDPSVDRIADVFPNEESIAGEYANRGGNKKLK